MTDRIQGSEEKIKGMDLIHNLLPGEMVQRLNEGYLRLLVSLDKPMSCSKEDVLWEALKEFEAQGMRYSTTPMVTGKGNYTRFVFRNKFVILFPYTKDKSIRFCKVKREPLKIKKINKPDGDLCFLDQIRCQIKREMIDDKDFFEFEEILEKLSEKIQEKIAA